MSLIVRLTDIVDALEMLFDEHHAYLDLDTGEVVTVSEDLLCEAEDPGDEGPDLSDGQAEEWDIAKRIVSSGRFRALPTKLDVHEWEIMRDFSESVEAGGIREDLSGAIHGAGAFRHFKDAAQRHGIEPAWHAFRTAALRQSAADWCEANQIA